MRTTLSLVLLLLLISACEFSGKRIKGNGRIATEEKNVGSFTGISTSGSIDIIVTDGPTNSLKIEADENLIEYLVVENRNGTVKVYTKEGINLNPVRHIKVYATAPSFSNLDVSGSAKIQSNGKIKGENLHSEVSGSGDIILDVDTPTMEADIAGSGSARISGTTKNFSASVSGSGEIRCFDLLSENTEIDIAGSGDAEVYASKTLDVDVSGAGNVKYRGNPSVKQSIAGAGSVRKAD
jgi:hypothetical protein